MAGNLIPEIPKRFCSVHKPAERYSGTAVFSSNHSVNFPDFKTKNINMRAAYWHFMAFYLAAFWALMTGTFAVYLFANALCLKNILCFMEKYALLPLLAAFAFLIMSFVTNDPFLQGVGLPKEYEWLAGLILSLFGLWKFYLGPLKERVISGEKEISSISTKVSGIQEDIILIKRKLLG